MYLSTSLWSIEKIRTKIDWLRSHYPIRWSSTSERYVKAYFVNLFTASAIWLTLLDIRNISNTILLMTTATVQHIILASTNFLIATPQMAQLIDINYISTYFHVNIRKKELNMHCNNIKRLIGLLFVVTGN